MKDYSDIVYKQIKGQIFKLIDQRRSEKVIIPDKIICASNFFTGENFSNINGILKNDFDFMQNKLKTFFKYPISFYWEIDCVNKNILCGVSYKEEIDGEILKENIKI